MPAENSTTKKPVVHQTSTAMMTHSASCGSPSQVGTSSKPTALSVPLIMPWAGSKANWNRMATIAIESTCGKK